MTPKEMTVNMSTREAVRYKFWHKDEILVRRQILSEEHVIRSQLGWTIFNQVYSYDQIES